MTVFDASPDGNLTRRIAALVALSRNDEACRLLGVDGVLETHIDITFVDDPLDWVAFDIAEAIRTADSDEPEEKTEENAGPTVTALVAELRLWRLLGGDVSESALAAKVRGYL